MTIAEAGGTLRSIPAAAWGLALAAAIVVVFIASGLNAPLWFDEANYLSLADGIARTGYPVWLWKPDQPELFEDSPPGLIYIIEWFSVWISGNVATLRLVCAVVFGAIPWLALIVVARRRGVSLSSLAIAALFATTIGIWLLELVQVRMDLPIAGLAAGALVLAAVWIDPEDAHSKGWWALAAIAVLSAAAFLIKYEALCLTMALILAATADAVWLRTRRTAIVLAAHLAGFVCALAILVGWTAYYRADVDIAPLIDAVESNLFGRILPNFGDLAYESENFRRIVKMMLTIAAPPLVALIAAAARGALDWRRDPLLRLCTFFGLAVLGFNAAVYRMPGAGDYYMVEAVLPLGYVLGRSLEALVPSGRARGAAAALVLAISLGLNAPGYLPYSLPSLEAPVAAALAPVLALTDILLLGDTSQSRAIPHLLGRSDRYCYLFFIDPAKVPTLLARRGSGQVGAIVLSPHALGRLHAPQSSAILAAVDENFWTLGPLTPEGPTIFLRRGASFAGKAGRRG